MFISTLNRDQFKPPQEVLDKACDCVRLTRNDRWSAEKAVRVREIRKWAQDNCESFIWWELEKHDDLYPVDREEVWLFYFYEAKDATAFRLKWL